MDELKSLITRLRSEKYPDADVIFLAGSVIRGEGTRTSDLDVVVAYNSLPNARRDSYRYGDWPVDPSYFSDLPRQNATYMIKALSVVEMPGTAIACGRKTLEIRHWRPGELPLLDLVIVQNKRRLTSSDPVDPEGKVVAIVDVRNVRDWKEDDRTEASYSKSG